MIKLVFDNPDDIVMAACAAQSACLRSFSYEPRGTGHPHDLRMMYDSAHCGLTASFRENSDGLYCDDVVSK